MPNTEEFRRSTHFAFDAASRTIAIAHTRKMGATEIPVAGQPITHAAGDIITRIDTYSANSPTGTITIATFDPATGRASGTPAQNAGYEYDANAR